MGLTPIKTRTFYGVSQVGMLVGTLVYVNAGTQLAQLDSLSGILSPGLVASFALLGVFPWLAKRLVKATGAEARATVLGHVQRGAMPTAEDRLLASALGVRAVDLLAEGKADRMVAWWNRQVIDVPLEKVVGRSRTVDPDGTLIRTARALGICLGDTA